MKYLRVPSEVMLANVKANSASWSAGMYRRVVIPTRKTCAVRDLLSGYDKGCDPGSLHYLPRSTHYFVRTKALQPHSYLLCPKGDSIIPVNPRVFVDMGLRDGDILLSKDSNVGECAMVDGTAWSRHMLSGGIVRLRPKINRYYLFAFLKHPLFRPNFSQWSRAARPSPMPTSSGSAAGFRCPRSRAPTMSLPTSRP